MPDIKLTQQNNKEHSLSALRPDRFTPQDEIEGILSKPFAVLEQAQQESPQQFPEMTM